MLKIRFLRTGKKHQPYFKIVVTDKSNPPRGGNFKAEVGRFNPRSKEVKLKEEKVKHWLEQGAQPSDRVHNLLVQEGVIEAEKVSVHASSEEPEPEKKQEKSEQEQKPDKEKPKEEQKEEKEQQKEEKEEAEQESNEDSDKKEA